MRSINDTLVMDDRTHSANDRNCATNAQAMNDTATRRKRLRPNQVGVGILSEYGKDQPINSTESR